MTAATGTCPKCRQPIAEGQKFCPDCGNDVTGVWGNNPALGGTMAVAVDPNVDTVAQLLSDATLGDYDIYGELGRGGMAAVYLGLDLSLNRKVAIKTMLPELVGRGDMVQRFKREAQTSAALSHPHIIQIFTVKETDKLVYFVMKFIEGRSLESVIHDKGKVPLAMAQTIMGQVGSALDYAHRKHVIHRDIKPANIMIDEDGWAIVTDFGIAKVQEAQNLTATGTAIGTPHYMSPEQFHNKAVTGASDQYSMGIVLFEMLAGKKPFDGGTYAEIITQHLFEPVPDLHASNPEVPEHVNAVVKKMLAKDPGERFPDLDTAVHALGQLVSKKEGDVIRTQMISLAKSGPPKQVRISVPMSPIPATKKRTAPAATELDQSPALAVKKNAAPVARPPKTPAKAGGGAGKWIGIAATLVILGGGGGYYYLNFMRPQAAGSAGQVAGNPTPASEATAAPATPAAGLTSAPGATTESPAAGVAAAAVDSSAIRLQAAQAELDGIRLSALREETKRLQDSITTARAAARRAAAAAARAPAQDVQAAAAARAPAQDAQAAPSSPATPAAAAQGSATIRMASTTRGAAVYVNNAIESLISTARDITIPAGKPVKVEIRAPGCTSWDTTITAAPDSRTTIGRRNPRC